MSKYPKEANGNDDRGVATLLKMSLAALIGGGLLLFAFAYLVYSQFRIDVPSMHYAVLIKKTGEDLGNDVELSPDVGYKGVQAKVLTEGRYFKNPYVWDWRVYPMIEIPEGNLGVRVRLYGDDLPYGHFVATKESEKGIVEDVLKPGRYAINAVVRGEEGTRPYDDYAEIIELHEPVTIPAGYKGIVTNLAGPMPEDPNLLLVPLGYRGVQRETLEPQTYYMNPYMYDIAAIDCRSQRFNLAENDEMGFPSKDGFWVSLDGIIEFRVKPEMAAEVYVMYNDSSNDADEENAFSEEVVRKVIMPNARAFCRLRGSDLSGREFIGGENRGAFQKAFQEVIHRTCEKQGVEIVQTSISRINPPQAIAKPVRDREVSRQEMKRFQQEKLQQDAEAKLAVEKELIKQKQELVSAQQEVVQKVTKAKESQQVAVLKAQEELAVSEQDMQAAVDKAQAILARARAEATIVKLQNEAEAAGWKQSVEALGGDGEAYARYVMYQKLAPGFRSIMTNTADSPLMEVFRGFANPSSKPTVVPTYEATRPSPIATPEITTDGPETETPGTNPNVETQSDGESVAGPTVQ